MHVRTTFLVVAWTLTLAATSSAQGQPNTTKPDAAKPAAQAPTAPEPAVVPDIDTVNFFDVGLRGTIYTSGSDEARYRRYRDLRNGPTFDALRFFNDSPTRWYHVEVDHAGYRDQRYLADANQFGRWKVRFGFDQIPLFYSEDTATLYGSPLPGVLRIDDPLQAGVEAKTTTLAGISGQATPFDMRTKRSTAVASAIYEATRNIDFSLFVKNTAKIGSQPWAGTFGFGDAVELAVPVDTRTTELDAGLEWANDHGSARLGYEGSFFANDIGTLVWDNPLRITDSSTAGPFQGRMSLWPDSTMNSGNALGAINLPARSRATAYISVGRWSQDEPLIPFTINSTLPVIPLDRPTADVSANITATHFVFTSRPLHPVSFVARYRSYDYDNKSPLFHVAQTVSYDTSVAAFAHGGNSPYSIDRKTFDAEATYLPVGHVALRAGYTFERVGQTFRTFDSTDENVARLSADLTGNNWVTLRAAYEHGKRVGSGFDDQVLDDIGEQVSLRQFDISNRTIDRFMAIAMVMPTPALSFNGNVTVGNDDRGETGFGVLNGEARSYSVGVDYAPKSTVSLGASYVYERYGTLQRSRQANPGPQFDDPTRDWTTDANDRANTFTGSLDLIKWWTRTDARLTYDYSDGDSRYVYGLAPNTTLPPVQQLPSVINRRHRGTLDVRYYLTNHVAIGGMYWYETYHVEDFAMGTQTLSTLAQPSFLTLGYNYRPYTANTFVARLTRIW